QGRQGRAPRRRAGRRAGRVRRHRPVDHGADARDRLHRPHREGAARMSTATLPPHTPAEEAHVGIASAFKALLYRDLYVLSRNLREFIPRTVLQPLLLVFVFTYVFPKIGQGVGGASGSEQFSTMLIAGVLASVVMFQGVQAVALPMVQEFGYTREI